MINKIGHRIEVDLTQIEKNFKIIRPIASH